MTKKVKSLGVGGRIRVELLNLKRYDKPDLNRLVKLANVSDKDLPHFANEFHDYAKGFSISYARTLLKQAWHGGGGDAASMAATKILFPTWMGETIAKAIEKAAAAEAERPLTPEEGISLLPLRADWRRGMLTFMGQSGFQIDFYTLLKCSNRAKFCEWPDCNTPYFIAKNRTSARYCSDKCRIDAMLESKRKSWHKKEKKGKR